MIHIDINFNEGLKWYKNGNIVVKGFLFDKKNNFYRDSKLVEYFSNVGDEKTFKQRVLEANGFFSVVIENENKLFAAVDRLRSIPLFYGQKDGELYISDRAYWVRDQVNDLKIDSLSEIEFLRTGYVTGRNTLSGSVKQLEAGEHLLFDGKQIYTEFYYIHLHGSYLSLSEAEYFDDLDSISEAVFQRLIKSAEGKTFVIPLSSGYDSRYIAAMLKKMHYKNVICYTYGRAKSYEVNISSEVAQILGYQWYFIEYNREKWWDYFQSKKVAEYNLFSFNLASLPHVQEYIAIKELKEKSLIPPDSVFIPGFCGDLLGGSYVPNGYKLKSKDLMSDGIVEYIYKKHFNLDNPIQGSSINLIKKHLKETLKCYPDVKNIDDFVSINEAWFTNHKVAKYLVNSLRLYEFFGFEWRMPLWDNEIIEYWYRIPNDQRINDKLYDKYLFNRIFKPQEIDLVIKDSFFRIVYLNILKKIFPLGFLNFMRKRYMLIPKKKIEVDYNAFSELSTFYHRDIKSEKAIKKTDDINQIFSKWLISKIKKQAKEN